jgi:hypothetical protein
LSKNKSKGGRPEFKPTRTLRRRVSIAAGGGMSHEEIAIGLGISRGTLEKHFEEELSTAAYQRRLEVLDAMHESAVDGNVAAQKAYLAMEPAIAAPPEPPVEEQAKPKPVGKKEQADADAAVATVGTEWHDVLPARKPH